MLTGILIVLCILSVLFLSIDTGYESRKKVPVRVRNKRNVK